jgi:hypothetical protein
MLVLLLAKSNAVNDSVVCSSTTTDARPDLILTCTTRCHSAVKVCAQLKQAPIDSPVDQSSQLRSAEIVTQFAY